MWLRSRCGGNLDEGLINTQLLTLSSYLDFATNHVDMKSNMYDFCDNAFCDYQMVYEFLMDMRLQAKVTTICYSPYTGVLLNLGYKILD